MIAATTTRLQIRDLSVLFPGVRAVDRVNLTVEPGEFFSLLGPSGCGKTTLLRTIAGFYRQNEGTIHFNERQIDRIPAHKRDTGMVFQHYAIFPHLTVWQNVAYGLRTRPGSKEQKAERVRAALELVDLEGLEQRRPRQLSGGQQQRVAVARAIVIEPTILLMDEPLANLDAKLRIRLRTDLRTLQQRLGITTIYVTHDQEEALSLSDRIAVMFDGKVHQVGTPDEIYAQPTHRRVAEFVGEGNYLDAQVRDAGNGRVTVELAGGGTLTAAVETTGGVPRGTPVAVSFRLHQAKVALPGAGPSDNTLQGTVAHRIYLGGTVRYLIDVAGGGTVQAEHYVVPGQTVHPGDTIMVRVDPTSISLFDADGALLGRPG